MESASDQINLLHATYCKAVGIELPLSMTFERWWISAVLAGVTPEVVELCIAERRKFNAQHPTCKKGLELKKLIRDEEDVAVMINEVAVVIAERRKKLYPPGKAEILRATGRPDEPPPPADAKHISEVFATIRKAVECVILLLAVNVCAQSITLAWDANTETNLAGYKLLGGAASGAYTRTNLVGLTNRYTVTNLPPGRSFWVVTAFDTDGNETDPSNEISWLAPSGLTIARTNAAVVVGGLAPGSRLQVSDQIKGPWWPSQAFPTNNSVTMPIFPIPSLFFTTNTR